MFINLVQSFSWEGQILTQVIKVNAINEDSRLFFILSMVFACV